MESFREFWGGLGRLLEGSARSVVARVASERSWRPIWKDFGSIWGGFWLFLEDYLIILGAKAENSVSKSEQEATSERTASALRASK